MRWLDEFVPGETFALGSHTFDADAIVAFARDFDPQPFHLDEDAGRASLFGGLAASGWHVACAWMKLWIAHQSRAMAERAARGGLQPIPGPSPGFDDMRWLRPVLAGDTVAYTTTILAARPSKSRPEWGIVDTASEGRVADTLVFSFTGHIFMPTRPEGAA